MDLKSVRREPTAVNDNVFWGKNKDRELLFI